MPAAVLPQSQCRLRSLDVFRGLCVIGMMLVDWTGDWDRRLRIFAHSEWAGITAPDFIFPSFLFIMGVAIPFALQAKKDAGTPPTKLYGGILRRSALLFLFGYFLNICWIASPTVLPMDWGHMRLMGVLQRFALVYPVAAVLFLHLEPRRLVQICAAILLGNWALMTLVPVPGFGRPDLLLLPAGTVTPNFATWFDLKVLGPVIGPDAPYDPEGLVSTLPALATGLLGVLAGLQLRRRDLEAGERLNRLFTWGVGLVVLGYLWGQGYPLCKKLWSGSFVVLMGGWGMLILGALHGLLDLRGHRGRGWDLPTWFGTNAVASILTFTFLDNVMSRIPTGHHANHAVLYFKEWLYEKLLCTWLPPQHASWAYSVAAILLLSLLFRGLHQKKWFLRV
jgi:predicted acyltransferase